jgi:hypothetical protein
MNGMPQTSPPLGVESMYVCTAVSCTLRIHIKKRQDKTYRDGSIWCTVDCHGTNTYVHLCPQASSGVLL